MTTPAPESLPQDNLLRRTLRRRWNLILVIWLIGSVAIVAAVALNVRPSYRAASFLHVDPAAPDLFGTRDNGDQLDTFLQTQVQLITSPTVLTAAGTNAKAAVLPRIQTAGDVVIELRKSINVAVIPNTYLIEVSMTGPSAYEAATLVNTVVEAFLNAHGEWSDGMTRNQIKNLETYLSDLRNQAEELERKWKDLVSRGEVQVVARNRPAGEPIKEREKPDAISIEEFRQIRQELFTVGLDLTVAQALATSLKNAASNAEKAPSSLRDEAVLGEIVERRFKADLQVVDLANSMAEARRTLEEARKTLKDGDDPEIQKASKKLEALSSQYSKLWDEKSRQLRALILAESKPVEQELAEAETRVLRLGVRQKALKGLYDKFDLTNKKNTSDEVEIALIRDERESLKGMQEAVNRRLEQLKFDARDEARIRQINAAMPPGRPIRDDRMMLMSWTPAVMLPLAFLFGLCAEAMRPRPTRIAKTADPIEEV